MIVRRLIATLGIAVVIGSLAVPASAAPPGTESRALTQFISRLTDSQRQQFNSLSASQQSEMAKLFTDPQVLTGELSADQVARKYAGARVSDSTGTTKTAMPTARSVHPSDRTAGASPATTYSVHSAYHHTVTFLFFSNTATLDYYYYTNAVHVTGDQRCTWTDSGISVNDIDNISVDHWVSSGYGYCYATIQVSASFWVSPGVSGHGYVYQDMQVNGSTGVIWTYFHEVAP